MAYNNLSVNNFINQRTNFPAQVSAPSKTENKNQPVKKENYSNYIIGAGAVAAVTIGVLLVAGHKSVGPLKRLFIKNKIKTSTTPDIKHKPSTNTSAVSPENNKTDLEEIISHENDTIKPMDNPKIEEDIPNQIELPTFKNPKKFVDDATGNKIIEYFAPVDKVMTKFQRITDPYNFVLKDLQYYPNSSQVARECRYNGGPYFYEELKYSEKGILTSLFEQDAEFGTPQTLKFFKSDGKTVDMRCDFDPASNEIWTAERFSKDGVPPYEHVDFENGKPVSLIEYHNPGESLDDFSIYKSIFGNRFIVSDIASGQSVEREISKESFYERLKDYLNIDLPTAKAIY